MPGAARRTAVYLNNRFDIKPIMNDATSNAMDMAVNISPNISKSLIRQLEGRTHCTADTSHQKPSTPRGVVDDSGCIGRRGSIHPHK